MAGNRPSRTLTRSNATQAYLWVRADGKDEAAKRELLLILRDAGVPQNRLQDEWAWVKSVLARIQACMALDPQDVKPIASHKDLWEVRIHRSPYNLVIRLYHAEIDPLPQNLLALRAHRKVTKGTRSEISSLQDAEVFTATKRLDAARSNGFLS